MAIDHSSVYVEVRDGRMYAVCHDEHCGAEISYPVQDSLATLRLIGRAHEIMHEPRCRICGYTMAFWEHMFRNGHEFEGHVEEGTSGE